MKSAAPRVLLAAACLATLQACSTVFPRSESTYIRPAPPPPELTRKLPPLRPIPVDLPLDTSPSAQSPKP